MNTETPIVGDVMSRRVHTLSPSRPVSEALAELADRGWSGAVVVDAQRRPVGVFSERDALRVLANARFHNLPEGTVADHMSRAVMSVAAEDDCFTVSLRMIGDGVRRYPVVDDDGVLVGLVTVSDLSRALAAAGPGSRARTPEHPPGAAWDPRRNGSR